MVPGPYQSPAIMDVRDLWIFYAKLIDQEHSIKGLFRVRLIDVTIGLSLNHLHIVISAAVEAHIFGCHDLPRLLRKDPKIIGGALFAPEARMAVEVDDAIPLVVSLPTGVRLVIRSHHL